MTSRPAARGDARPGREPRGRHAAHARAEPRRAHAGDRRRERIGARAWICAAAGCAPRPARIARRSTPRASRPTAATLVTTRRGRRRHRAGTSARRRRPRRSRPREQRVLAQIAGRGRTLYTAGLDGTVLSGTSAGRAASGGRSGSAAPATAQARAELRRPPARDGQMDGKVSLVDLAALSPARDVPGRQVERRRGPARQGHRRSCPAASCFVMGSTYGSVALVDTDRGRVKRLRSYAKVRTGAADDRQPVWTPGVSADGRLLVTGSNDGEVRLWSLPTALGRADALPTTRTLDDAAQPRRAAGSRVLPSAARACRTGSRSGTSGRGGGSRRCAQPGGASSTRCSPDGRRFAGRRRATGGRTSTRPRPGEPVARVLSGGKAAWLAWSPDSRTLATGNTDGGVRLWDVASGQALGAPLPGLPALTPSRSSRPTAHTSIAAQDNGRAFVWDIRPASLVRHACAVAGRRLTRAEWERVPARARRTSRRAERQPAPASASAASSDRWVGISRSSPASPTMRAIDEPSETTSRSCCWCCCSALASPNSIAMPALSR